MQLAEATRFEYEQATIPFEKENPIQIYKSWPIEEEDEEEETPEMVWILITKKNKMVQGFTLFLWEIFFKKKF